MWNRSWIGFSATALCLFATACSGSSGGSDSVNGVNAGLVLTSCTNPSAHLCTQIYTDSAGVSAQNGTCTGVEMGKPGTGCSSKSVLGCCTDTSNASREEQCYYSSDMATSGEKTCKEQGKTWSKTL